MKFDYILSQLGEEREKYFNSTAPPVIQTSSFCYPDIQSFKKAFEDELENHIYTRGNNPTVAILRKKLAALEKTEDALVFGSGAAAISAAIISQVKTGDHVVCVENPYGWTKSVLEKFLKRFGVDTTFSASTTKAITASVQSNTKLIMLESPNSITFQLQDLEAIADFAKEKKIVTAIDNSYSSPYFQNPAKLGIDIVLHSGTKYINGHSDVVVGVCCSSKKIIDQIFLSEFMTLGAIISPHDAALVIRGLRTLPIRMERIQQSTKVITNFLLNHPKIEKLIYPWSENFEDYVLALKQMTGGSGLFSVLVKANSIDKVEAFISQLNNFYLAVSWGGYESFVMPFCLFRDIPGRPDSKIPWNLIRFSIGLEEPEYLINDLRQALTVL